ncbi:pyridoxamine 5'-phosphate oxidase family protein [Allosphingosinicella indica]|uniref:General stress protein 26 n=1 Tax=Allosphingosinicella indica TaxID=941907 RepID=A0A1X7G9V2_9SPHN|nr:pyridoxamine 5'-phosphate oxidase family protein [Allosphingosinicella indica]SMF66453.1 General stress protein 26 [Allosphingosinicella indica]
MTSKSLADLAEKMRDIDFTMLSTKTSGGAIHARPMSNNRDVDYDGDSYYFTNGDTAMVAEIERDPEVGLAFQAKAGIIGQRPLFVAVQGRAELIRDRDRFAAHWTKDLDRWFEQGIDTPGLVMIKVHAHHAHYWDGAEEGEVSLERAAA